MSWDSICGCILTSGISTMAIIMMANSAYVCSPAWSSRTAAGTFAWGVVAFGGISSFRWLNIFAFVQYLGALGNGNRRKLHRTQGKGIPPYQFGTQALWDQCRAGLVSTFWWAVTQKVVLFCNLIAPEGFKFYVEKVPIFELGQNVNLGVAYLHSPKKLVSKSKSESRLTDGTISNGDASDPGRPDRIMCTSSHIDNSQANGLSDFAFSLEALRKDWESLKGTEGLVGNVACVFPHIEGTPFSKLMQFEAWNADESAKAWLKRSTTMDGCRMQEVDHLKALGNYHVSMSPLGEIIHQDRCFRCKRVVEAASPGLRAPPVCNICQGQTFRYPIF
jgi:hypothetical protein